jgi:hypothetical protein
MKISSTFIGILTSTALLFSLGACGKKESASCEQVSAHAMKMIEEELAKDGDPDRLKTARANLPTLQNALLKACRVQEWDEASRKCILAAKTAAETTACNPGMKASVPGTPDSEDSNPQGAEP